MAKRYTNDELIESIQEFAAHLGHSPTASEVNDDSEFTCGLNTYVRRFGSWNKTLEQCNLRINEEKNYSRDYLIEQLQTFNNRLGVVPTQGDFRADKETPSPFPYQDTFGSWNEALRAAGLTPTLRHDISKNELITELTVLADELGRPPRYEEVADRDDTFSAGVYERIFGSFTDGLRAAELPVHFEAKLNREYLIEQLQELGEKLGGTPRYNELQEYPTYPSVWPYVCEFGTWNNALKEAGFELNDRSSVSADEILAELQSVADDLGRTPSIPEWREMDEVFGVTTIVRKFGTWIDAIEAAGLEQIDWSGENHWRYQGGNKLYYGPDWDEQREVAIQADNEQCQRCRLGRDEHVVLYGFDVHAHHIRPFKECREAGLTYAEANARSNLMTLCCECHPIVEANGLD